MCLLWRVVLVSDRIIFLSQLVLELLGFLWVIRYRPLWYLFGEYPIHQVKLNLLYLISLG